MKNNEFASAWHTPSSRNCGWLELMTTTATAARGGRPSYYGAPRHQIVTSMPGPVRDAVDEIAKAAKISRIVAVSDLTAIAAGRADLALRLSQSAFRPLRDAVAVAQLQPVDSRGWPVVTTQVPVALLPDLDALAAQTGTSRSRIVANLVGHIVSQTRPDIAQLDIAWVTQQQEEFRFAI